MGSGRLARTLESLHHPKLSHSITTFLSLPQLKATHAHIVVSGLAADPFTTRRLLASAALSSSSSSNRPLLDYAHAHLLPTIPNPTLFMFNTMIRAFSSSPEPLGPVQFYVRMLRSSISPDRITFPFLLKSCSLPASPGLGRGLHCHVVKRGFRSDLYVANNAIAMYSAWADMASAELLFDELRRDAADVVSWTTMITGYSACGRTDRARWFFDSMPPAVKNSITWNAMITGYARAGRVTEARELFDRMPDRNAESWASMVSGFARCGLCEEALSVFDEMVRCEAAPPNEAVLVSAVSSCAQLQALERGEWVRGYIEKSEHRTSLILATALVDMYGKCGAVGKAVGVFSKMPAKNVYSWNSMINALAVNGLGKQALTLFWKMRLAGLVPNAVTFVGLLSACSHSGLVEEGRWFFETMTTVHGIRPSEEHYGCMVDLLARAGLIDEAVDFVDKMPVVPHPGLWGALAGGCKVHGNVGLGEEIGKRLIELEPHHGGRYALLANIYSAARRWDDMVMVRELLKGRRVAKAVGNSSVVLESPAEGPNLFPKDLLL